MDIKIIKTFRYLLKVKMIVTKKILMYFKEYKYLY